MRQGPPGIRRAARRAGALDGPTMGQGGFTLLEVLVAVAVVGFALVSLLGLHGRNVKMTIRDQNMTRATLLARELISQVEFTVATQGLDGLSSSQGSPEAYPELRYEIEVNTTDLEEIRVVIVRVIWDESTPHACELFYYVREQALPS
jgi:general secretion pathway protein I